MLNTGAKLEQNFIGVRHVNYGVFFSNKQN
jgi:hypothetical protein